MEHTDDSIEKALILINAIKNELAAGTKHYNNAGALLTTIEEIVACLRDEGRVTLEPAPSRKELFEVMSKAQGSGNA